MALVHKGIVCGSCMSFRFNVDSQTHESSNLGSAPYCLGDAASIINGPIVNLGALYYTYTEGSQLEPDIQVVSIYFFTVSEKP